MDEKALVEMVRGVVREELNTFRQEVATKEDLKAFATKEDFLEMESRLSSALQNVREGVRLSLIEVEHELREIKSKLRFYDFDYLARQNDTIVKVLQDLYQEKTLVAARLKEHEGRIETIESKL